MLDNRGGAGSTIGTDIAAKAAPDGYTLFQANLTLCVSYAVRKAALRPRARFRADHHHGERRFVPRGDAVLTGFQ